jgi:cyclopropane fatty-acyl-phospholipid synthase-like methyltransferase
MSISDQGYWVGLEASSQHIHDDSLCENLIKFYKNEAVTSVVDLGCGMGNYVKSFREHGLNADGFDGNPYTPDLTNQMCKIIDLSVPQKFDEPYDWVQSLEVGEHLPPQFEDVFINNLHNNNKRGILISWAIKGQGGHGHVNEQNNDYIKNKICSLGYENDIEAETQLRNGSNLFWFRNTIMVFRRK